MPEIHDYLIIGSGAGGAMAAHQLVVQGKRVLLLEKGSELPDDGSTLDATLVAGGHFNSKEVWNNARGASFMPEEHFNLGGKTRWYGAALLRNDPAEFRADPALGLCAWPFDYAEFEPYYREAEQLIGVHTFAIEADLQRLAVDLGKHGWQTQPLQLGLSPEIVEHLNEATHFDGYALPKGLKSDAKFRLLDPLKASENLTLVMNATVRDLLPSGENPTEVVGVRCTDGREYFARHILVAAGAMHSPRLLQRYFLSTGLSEHLPAAQIAGRNFKRHILTAVIGFGWRIKRDVLCKTRLFLHSDFPHSSSQPLGGWADRETIRFLLPGWLPKWLVEFFALRAYGFFLQTEDGSHADNRVIGESGDGSLPTLDYHAERRPELAREHRAMVFSFMSAMLSAGLVPFKQTIGLSGMAHCGGTLMTGNDPATSVVDAQGKVHGMQNIYVVDGSVLPRLGRMNPALSIYAWALRVTQGLLANR
jgi:choline dehydrogenase-like flavoprotein